MKRAGLVAILAGVVLAGCTPPWVAKKSGTFADDLAFLKEHTDVFVLKDATGQAQVAIVPLYQGRVMTSTASGPEGLSYGWINRELIESGKRLPHINPFGGEDRMWLGPEGGQYSIFFKPGAKFEFEAWQTPEAIDWGGWEIISQTADSARFQKKMALENHSGTRFDVLAQRTVRLLSADDIQKHLGVAPGPNVKAAGFESDNQIVNTGTKPWKKKTGLLSIWILCMFNPSPAVTVVIPVKEGPEDQLGPVVNDEYFGKVAADRLVTKGGVVYFKCDGKSRGKIGINPKRAKPTFGSYDAANQVLTIAQATLHEGVTDYVNSLWKMQEHPYAGDAVNSYNDGPTPTGKPLGPFYELESSSPAAALKPGETMRHTHRTIHLEGPQAELDAIAKATLGVGLEEIKSVFK